MKTSSVENCSFKNGYHEKGGALHFMLSKLLLEVTMFSHRNKAKFLAGALYSS